jgi:hypothetical protein
MRMKPVQKQREKPDYTAMAETLVRIAQELKSQAQAHGSVRDLEQAERLERIAAEIQASSGVA